MELMGDLVGWGARQMGGTCLWGSLSLGLRTTVAASEVATVESLVTRQLVRTRGNVSNRHLRERRLVFL